MGSLSPIRIQLGVNRPKFVLTELNNLTLNFDDLQTSIYIFLLQRESVRIALLENHEEEFKDCYRRVKNGNMYEIEIGRTIRNLVDPRNPEVFTQQVSKINKKLKDLLGETFSKPYLIVNSNGKYKVNLSRNIVQIL